MIFISIDDNEQANLKVMCDAIFIENNFNGQIVWQKKYGPANDATGISNTHEYVLSYVRKEGLWTPVLIERSDKQLEAYRNPDDDPRGVWRASDFSARTKTDSNVYEIELPNGRKVLPPKSRSWITSAKRFSELCSDNRIWFGVDGSARPMQKKFLSEVKSGITPQTWWSRDFVKLPLSRTPSSYVSRACRGSLRRLAVTS